LFYESLDIVLYGGGYLEFSAGLYRQFLAILNHLFGVSFVLPQAINILLFSLKMNLILNEGRY